MSKLVIGILIAIASALSIARHFLPDARPNKSIAVLPFVDLGSVNDQGYFVDGLTEEITGRLAQSGLTVAAANSAADLKAENLGVSQIARTLGVDAVLQGSVRRDGYRVRATVILFDAAKQSVTWKDDLDLGGNSQFALQDELAKSVVPAVHALLVE